MLQNLKTDLALAEEFILLRKEMRPKEDRIEELKVALRAFGPNEYPIEHVGIVKVSQPGVSRKTGTRLKVDETKIANISPKVFATVLKAGLLSYEDVYSRETASKVEAQFD